MAWALAADRDACEHFPALILWPDLQVREVLAHIEAGALLPPLVVLQALAANPQLKLAVVKDYAARALAVEGAAVEEDRKAIARFEEETASMRAEIAELKTKVGPRLQLPCLFRLTSR